MQGNARDGRERGSTIGGGEGGGVEAAGEGHPEAVGARPAAEPEESGGLRCSGAERHGGKGDGCARTWRWQGGDLGGTARAGAMAEGAGDGGGGGDGAGARERMNGLAWARRLIRFGGSSPFALSPPLPHLPFPTPRSPSLSFFFKTFKILNHFFKNY